MAESEFTIKEIVQELREDMKTMLDQHARVETTLESIHDQVRKTNGRVTALEHSDIKNTTKIGAASALISTFIAAVISYIVKTHS